VAGEAGAPRLALLGAGPDAARVAAGLGYETVHVQPPGGPVAELAEHSGQIYSVDPGGGGFDGFVDSVLRHLRPHAVVPLTEAGRAPAARANARLGLPDPPPAVLRALQDRAGPGSPVGHRRGTDRRRPVLILNSRPHRWLYRDDRCLVPLAEVAPHLVTHNYGGVGGLTATDFPDTAICDLREAAHVARLAEWLIREHGIRHVVAPNERFVLLAAELRTRHGLPGLSAGTARLFRDKVAMKAAVAAAGVRVPRFVPVDRRDDLAGIDWSRPQVLKSRFGVGSMEVHVVTSAADAERTWDAIDPPPGAYQVEEFVAGAMYHCDAVVRHGTVVFSSVARYLAHPGDYAADHFGGTMLVPPGPLPERIRAVNARALAALGLRDGVTHLELFHTPADELVFCEVAARPAGGGVERLIRHGHGVDIVESAIRLECGLDPFTGPPAPVAPDEVWGCVGIFPNGSATPVDPGLLARLGVVEHVLSTTAGDGHGRPQHCSDFADLHLLRAPDEAAFHANVVALRSAYRAARPMPGPA
jgi:hypothetical protein